MVLSWPTVQEIAVPATLSIICFQAFPSQWLFNRIEPHPLPTRQVIEFNSLLVCIFVCYYRTAFSNPGVVPNDWYPIEVASTSESALNAEIKLRQRWCRKCCTPRYHNTERRVSRGSGIAPSLMVGQVELMISSRHTFDHHHLDCSADTHYYLTSRYHCLDTLDPNAYLIIKLIQSALQNKFIGSHRLAQTGHHGSGTKVRRAQVCSRHVSQDGPYSRALYVPSKQGPEMGACINGNG